MTALHSKSPLKNSMARISYNGPNQPNFSLKVQGRWAISRVSNQNPTPMIQGMNYGMSYSMVMSWLLYSMQPKISQTYLFLSTAKEI